MHCIEFAFSNSEPGLIAHGKRKVSLVGAPFDKLTGLIFNCEGPTSGLLTTDVPLDRFI